MCDFQLAEHEGRGVSVFTELRHRLRIAFTGTGVAVLVGLSLFASIAHADEASLEELDADPTASISRGTFKVDNFNLFRILDDPSLRVEVSFIPGGIRFTGDYETYRFDLMSFNVTTSDRVAVLLDMTIAFDADPLNPDVDAGSAWVSAIVGQDSPFPWSRSVIGVYARYGWPRRMWDTQQPVCRSNGLLPRSPAGASPSRSGELQHRSPPQRDSRTSMSRLSS